MGGAKEKAKEIDEATRWWSSYPHGKYSKLTRPLGMFKTYLNDVFEPAKRLVRSASVTRLTYTRDADVSTTPLKRSNSYSSLSPSHALDVSERTVTRYIPTYTSYNVKPASWYNAVRNYRSPEVYRRYEPYKVIIRGSYCNF